MEISSIHQSALEYMPQPICVVNSDEKLLAANRVALQLLGYQAHELKGIPMACLFTRDADHMRAVKRDGSTIAIQLSTNETRFENQKATLLTFRDITAEVKENQILLFEKVMATSSHDFFLTCTYNLQIQELSGEVFEVLGYQPYELLNKNLVDLRSYIFDPDKPEFDKMLDKLQHGQPDYVIEQKLAVLQFILRFVAKCGEIVPIETVITFEPQSLDTSRLYYVGALREITDRINTETQEVRKSIEQIRAQRVGAKKFIALVLKMVEEPMTKTSLLVQQFATGKTPSQELSRTLENITPCIQQIQLIAQDLKEFIELQERSQTTVPGKLFSVKEEEFTLKPTVENCIRLHSKMAAEKKLFLRFTIDSQVPTDLIGDPARLLQILSNFVSNALKFTSTGGVLIQVILSRKEQEYLFLRFLVQDTGIGIDMENQKILFQPFQQLLEGIRESHKGSGLGLCIAKFLVEKMGGSIKLESALGKGSTFSFELPFKPFMKGL